MSRGRPACERTCRWFALAALGYALLAAPALIWFMPPPAHLAATALLGAALAALSAIDIESYRLPDYLTLPLAAAGLLLSVLLGWDEPWLRMSGAILGYGALYLIAALYERLRGQPGLGLGDAKLFAASGAWLGLEGLPSVLLIASVTALALAGIAAAAGRNVAATTRIAFGPFLALGTWLVWLYGPLTFGV